MYKLISKFMLDKLNNYGVIDKEISIYQFGMMITISYFFSSLIIIIIGIILNKLLFSIIYIFLFHRLREFSGGYHATSYLKCEFLFVLLFLICLCLTPLITFQNSTYICLLLLTITVHMMPTYHPNKQIIMKMKYKFKIISLQRFFLAIIFALLLSSIRVEFSIFINIIIIVIALIEIQFILNRKEAYDEIHFEINC